jgi:hypothetical protein
MATDSERGDVNSFRDISGGNNQFAAGSGSHTQTYRIENAPAADPLAALLDALRQLQAELDSSSADRTASDAAGRAIAELSAIVKEPQRDKNRVGAALCKARGLAVQALGLTETITGSDQAVSALFH